MNVKQYNTVTICELFDAAADARPETVYLIETWEIDENGDGKWMNMGSAKIIFLGEDTALYVDDNDGYKLLTDLDYLDGSSVRFTPAN